MLERQEAHQADQGNDTDHGDRPEGRTPACVLAQGGAQRNAEYVGQGQAGEHQRHGRRTAVGRYQAGGHHRTDAEKSAMAQGGDDAGEHQHVVAAGQCAE
ncbi:hypothetical protein D9M73_142970 [compost metagenome]